MLSSVSAVMIGLSSARRGSEISLDQLIRKCHANDAHVEQAPAVAPPTRTDDQIFSLSKWVPIGKSNCVLDVHKPQRNPIFPICGLTKTPNLPGPSRHPPTGLYSCKTAGYDRPIHPTLQDTLVIIHRSNIDYAKRIWEEFVQSIQTFLTDRKNLAMAARGKKKTAHLLIPSVRFTKLIIHHLRTKHNIHPRTGSPLHYSHEESILNTLRFVRKDGREIFGMSVPDAILIDEIKGAPYYGYYQEHVAKYQQFFDAERGKADEGRATESSDATKVTKPKATKVTKPSEPPIRNRRSKSSTCPETLSQNGNKQNEPREPSHPGYLMEQDSGKYNHLPEAPSQHTKPTRHADSPSLDVELPLTDSGRESDEEVSMINAGDQDEGHAGPNPSEQEEGQARPNPGIQDEG
ncbi:hypothetical protein Tco_0217039 [Tanacetum coccineum]